MALALELAVELGDPSFLPELSALKDSPGEAGGSFVTVLDQAIQRLESVSRG